MTRKLSTPWARAALALGALCLVAAAPASAQVVANAGEDLGLECSATLGTQVTLDGTASTVDGLPALVNPDASFLWEAPGILFADPTSATPTAAFPLGVTLVTLTLTVTDPVTLVETTASDDVQVSIGDTTPPTISSMADPMYLWPPNHKLVEVDSELVVMDACDPDPTVVLTSVESSERDDGIGDGNTSDDIQDVDLGTDDRSFLLRAERSGNGSGRIYAATYEATDASGNFSTGVVEIVVPHDQGQANAMKSAAKDAKDAFKEAQKAAKAAAKAAKKAAKAQAKLLKKLSKVK